MASDLATYPAAGRILMLCTDRRIDRRILLQADSLEEDGWQVKILAMPPEADSEVEDPRVIRIAARPGRENQTLRAYAIARRYLPMNGRLLRWLRSMTWRFLVDHERFYLNLFLADGLRHPADVVVAHDLPVLAVGRALTKAFQARLVYDSHELFCEQEFSRSERASWSKVERRHIHACDQVITVNPSIADELRQRYGLDKVEVIYNAERIIALPSTRSWYLHERFGIARDQSVLLLQGGFSAGRNLEELVCAMALLRHVPVHLVLLGDGKLADNLRRLIVRKRLQERVHLHPAVAQSGLLEVTASADAGIIPYQGICLNTHYCTPNKLFEFVAAGLPIIASDLPELRRLIHDKEIGQVANLATPNDIARAVEDFFSSGKLQHWRNNLLATRQAMSWQHESEKLKKIYSVFK